MNRVKSGIYFIIAELPNAMNIQVGKRREEQFEAGYYGYVGSALNNLEKRLARHLGTQKKLHWHIDYLLAVANVRAIVHAETKQKKECLVAQALSRKLASKQNFGSSDCKCPSHLFFCQNFEHLKKSGLGSFLQLNLIPAEINYCSDFTILK
jgi:Uri superfamily endonuclease